MKKRITLTLPEEVAKYIKAQAKAQKISVSKYMEGVFDEIIRRGEEAENKLKKVS